MQALVAAFARRRREHGAPRTSLGLAWAWWRASRLAASGRQQRAEWAWRWLLRLSLCLQRSQRRGMRADAARCPLARKDLPGKRASRGLPTAGKGRMRQCGRCRKSLAGCWAFGDAWVCGLSVRERLLRACGASVAGLWRGKRTCGRRASCARSAAAGAARAAATRTTSAPILRKVRPAMCVSGAQRLLQARRKLRARATPRCRPAFSSGLEGDGVLP